MQHPVCIRRDRGDEDSRFAARRLDDKVARESFGIRREPSARPVLDRPGEVDLDRVPGLGRKRHGAPLVRLGGKHDPHDALGLRGVGDRIGCAAGARACREGKEHQEIPRAHGASDSFGHRTTALWRTTTNG